MTKKEIINKIDENYRLVYFSGWNVHYPDDEKNFKGPTRSVLSPNYSSALTTLAELKAICYIEHMKRQGIFKTETDHVDWMCLLVYMTGSKLNWVERARKVIREIENE